MRDKNLDYTKWILTLLIVLYHIQFVGNEAYRYSFMLIKNLGDCVVPAFAIISGFLFWSTVKHFSDIKKKLRRRIYSLLIPYLLWNLLNTVILNLLSGYRGINIYHDIIMWNSSPHFWYIFMLIFWAALSPILYFFIRNRGGVVVLCLLSVSYLIYKGNNILHSRFIYILYVWSGVIGFYYPHLMSTLRLKSKKIWVLFLILLYLLIYLIYADNEIGMGLKVWLYGIRAVILLVVLLNIPFTKVSKMTGGTFTFSFWLFCVHFWLDAYISNLVYKYCDTPLLYQLITWLLVVIIGVGAGKLLMNLAPCVFLLLNGSRPILNIENRH